MQVYRPAKRFTESFKEVPVNKPPIIIEDSWKILDSGLTKIENEWKERMLIEQYSKECTKQNSRKIDDVDEFTVEELKCWRRLQNTKFDERYKNGDLYSKNVNNFCYSDINITYWQWKYSKEEHILVDIYFNIENNFNDNIHECGAIFLHNDVILINSAKCLYKTSKTSIELEKRLEVFKSLRK